MISPEVVLAIPAKVLDGFHFFAGLVLFIESLNKLERTSIFVRSCCPRLHATNLLKLLAWLLLAMGAGGALITPFLHLDPPTFQDVCVIVGFAVLVVRTRVKEFLKSEAK